MYISNDYHLDVIVSTSSTESILISPTLPSSEPVSGYIFAIIGSVVAVLVIILVLAVLIIILIVLLK